MTLQQQRPLAADAIQNSVNPSWDHVEPEQKSRSARSELSPAEAEAVSACLVHLVAGAFQLDELLLRLPSRGRANVARARQAAMYLAHTVCGLSLTTVGQVFDRDRTTVAHACKVIEDYREDPAFDRAMDMLERSAQIVLIHSFSEPSATRLGGLACSN